jgi:hypothetical protein
MMLTETTVRYYYYPETIFLLRQVLLRHVLLGHVLLGHVAKFCQAGPSRGKRQF